MPVEFGPFTLDADRRLLLRRGEPVHLFPKAFDLLQLLVADRPNVVTKAALIERLWPNSFVADNSLATLVSDVRTALGDTPRGSGMIRTVHAVGYAFVASAVERSGASDSHATSRVASDWRIVWDDTVLPVFMGENIVGRSGDGVIGLPHVTISRQHACISAGAEGVTVEDLGSKNGTWIGTKRLSGRHTVTSGDEIRFGHVLVRFVRLVHDASTWTAQIDVVEETDDSSTKS